MAARPSQMTHRRMNEDADATMVCPRETAWTCVVCRVRSDRRFFFILSTRHKKNVYIEYLISIPKKKICVASDITRWREERSP